MQSVMTHSFSNTPTIEAPRSKFDLSHGHKTTFDAGWLVPVFHAEVLPGDTWNLNMSAFARLSTPLFPILDNAYLDSHFFFVPYRLLWNNFRKFCGEQEDPGESIDYTIPVMSGTTDSDPEASLTTTTGRRSRLLNYLGIPDGIDPDDVDMSALPFRAYAAIYDEWFRDQNLIDSCRPAPGIFKGDGPDSIASTAYELKRRGKRHDYFSSALPWPQKGDAVTLPLGSIAPIDRVSNAPAWKAYNATTDNLSSGGDLTVNASGLVTDGTIASFDPNGGLVADLSTATAATVNDLREAFQVQKLLERDARAGTRYSEIVRNHFSVNFYDVSYRPEYLGGGSSPVNISPIAQTAQTATSGTSDGTGTGDLAAMGTVSVRGHGFSKSFVEHGIVMGIVSVRADLTYQQGLNRFFSHSTRYDKYWPSLAHLGEQEILNKELYCDGSASDDLVFGYQERYAEYRYMPSRISGLFQSTAASSLDPWHLSQEFTSLPTLGETFINEPTETWDRVVQVPSEPHFIFDSYFDIKAARQMPVFGIPGMIDHF